MQRGSQRASYPGKVGLGGSEQLCCMQCSPAHGDAAGFGSQRDIIIFLKGFCQGCFGGPALATSFLAGLQSMCVCIAQLFHELMASAEQAQIMLRSSRCKFHVSSSVGGHDYFETQEVSLAFKCLAVSAMSGPVLFLAVFGTVADLRKVRIQGRF